MVSIKPNTTTRIETLNRFTDLPALFAILVNKELTLLSPDSWDDKNDRNFMSAYARKNEYKSLLALCFSGQQSERYHHWRVFASGTSGVCIHFDKNKILNSIPQTHEFSHKKVKYRTLNSLNDESPSIDDLPFSKRAAFSDEEEYRVIYKSKHEQLNFASIKIETDAIISVIVNPWMPETLFNATRQIITSISDCEKIPVSQSSVIDSRRWEKFALEI